MIIRFNKILILGQSAIAVFSHRILRCIKFLHRRCKLDMGCRAKGLVPILPTLLCVASNIITNTTSINTTTISNNSNSITKTTSSQRTNDKHTRRIVIGRIGSRTGYKGCTIYYFECNTLYLYSRNYYFSPHYTHISIIFLLLDSQSDSLSYSQAYLQSYSQPYTVTLISHRQLLHTHADIHTHIQRFDLESLTLGAFIAFLASFKRL